MSSVGSSMSCASRAESYWHGVSMPPHETRHSSRLQIPVRQVKAAWFDDKDDVEFFPLHAVYAPKSLGALKGEPQDE